MEKPLDFLLENYNLELCSICGLKKKLTFEHMPPKASGNDMPVNIVGLENMVPIGGYLYGKFKSSPKGMGGYKLCESCNNLTGSWYAESYIDLSHQLNEFIYQNIGKKNVEINCKIKPLNFLKQAICLLLCADQATGTLREIINTTNFILDKEQKKLSNNIFISKLISLQPTYGFKGFSPMWNNVNGYTNNAEFVYPPFYFKAYLNYREMDQNSMDLINFKQYNYDETVNVCYVLDLSKLNQ